MSSCVDMVKYIWVYHIDTTRKKESLVSWQHLQWSSKVKFERTDS